MINVDETIDALRGNALEIDCKKMVLTQRKAGGARFEGPGYFRQTHDGELVFKLYVTAFENAEPHRQFQALMRATAGNLREEDAYYDLMAIGADGTKWNAERLLAYFSWDIDGTAQQANGNLQSLVAHLGESKQERYLRVHFFEEYRLPLHLMTQTEEHNRAYMVLDRAEFEACGCKFEIRVRDGSGDTVVKATSDSPFPNTFHWRIQEALQYITGKTVMWRARIESVGEKFILELASPHPKSQRASLWPPISPASVDFQHGWKLFARYLDYVIKNSGDMLWNPVAYHLYNARESSANSIDAYAMGVAVAVEAIASLVDIERKGEEKDSNARRLAAFQERMRECLSCQEGLADENLIVRMNGLIDAMATKRPQDTLYALATAGCVAEDYIKAWTDLRNRQVHPKLKDLKKPDAQYYENLFDRIHRAEVLLHQLTFYLIEYEGPFTDYGAPSYPSKPYPLALTGSSP